MAIRNFWVEADIPGRSTQPKGGPRSKEDGMSLRYYQRNKGDIEQAVYINSWEKDGKLFTEVMIDGKVVGRLETER
jgi:hypothetical protein